MDCVTLQRGNATMTSFFYDVNLHWRAAESLGRAY